MSQAVRRLQHALLTFFLTGKNPIPKSFMFEFCGEDDMSAQTLIVASLEVLDEFANVDTELRHWGATRSGKHNAWLERRNPDYMAAIAAWVIDYPLIPHHVATEMYSILDVHPMRSWSGVDATISIGLSHEPRQVRKEAAFLYHYGQGAGTMSAEMEAMRLKFESKEGIAVLGYNGQPVGHVTKFDPSDGHYEMRIDGDSLEAKMLMEHICPSVSISFMPMANGMLSAIATKSKRVGVDYGSEEDRTGGPETPYRLRFILEGKNGEANFGVEALYSGNVWAQDLNPLSNTSYEWPAKDMEVGKHRFHIHSTVSATGKGETYTILNIESVW